MAIPFPDVPITNFAVQAISSLKARNIVNGYPDGLFRPKDDISRAELTKIVVEAGPVGLDLRVFSKQTTATIK